MKKIFIILFALLFAAACMGCSGKDQFDFRKIKWGMDLDAVIQSEGREPDQQFTDTVLYKNVEIEGIEADLLYSFDENNQVKSATYSFDSSIATAENYAVLKKYAEKSYDDLTVMETIAEEKTQSALWENENTKISLIWRTDDTDNGTLLLLCGPKN